MEQERNNLIDINVLEITHCSQNVLEKYSLIYRKPGLFREIIVDSGVKTGDGMLYDVIFIGTDRGQVLKMAKALNQTREEMKPHVIEELQV